MGFFNRFRKPKPEMDDCDHLSGLGDNAQAWDNLDDDELKQVIAVKSLELSEEAQLEMTHASSGFVSEGIIDFWLGRLESGCSEAVFGSVVAAIARMPASAQAPYVLDMERLLPAYAGGEPMKLLRRTAFADYLEAIRPRLKALEQSESWPKVIPGIFESWEDAEAFREIAG